MSDHAFLSQKPPRGPHFTQSENKYFEMSYNELCDPQEKGK